MTTIVFANGLMAADTRGYSGNSGSQIPIGKKTKIFRFKDGRVFGCSSVNPGTSEQLVKWLLAGKPMDELPDMKQPDFEALEVMPDGTWFFYSSSFYPSGPLSGPYVAIGSGAKYALGALAMGASASEACGVAALLDPWSAAPIEVLPVGKPAGNFDLMSK